MNKQKKQYIQEYTNKNVCLDDEELEQLVGIFSFKQVSETEYLEKPGADISTIFLVVSGLIRYFYLDVAGKEWNKAFISPGAMST